MVTCSPRAHPSRCSILRVQISGTGLSVPTYAANLRALYIALRHAEIPVQIFNEDDCVAGRLYHTDLLIVTVPNVADAAAMVCLTCMLRMTISY